MISIHHLPYNESRLPSQWDDFPVNETTPQSMRWLPSQQDFPVRMTSQSSKNSSNGCNLMAGSQWQFFSASCGSFGFCMTLRGVINLGRRPTAKCCTKNETITIPILMTSWHQLIILMMGWIQLNILVISWIQLNFGVDCDGYFKLSLLLDICTAAGLPGYLHKTTWHHHGRLFCCRMFSLNQSLHPTFLQVQLLVQKIEWLGGTQAVLRAVHAQAPHLHHG